MLQNFTALQHYRKWPNFLGKLYVEALHFLLKKTNIFTTLFVENRDKWVERTSVKSCVKNYSQEL